MHFFNSGSVKLGPWFFCIAAKSGNLSSQVGTAI